MGGGYPDGRTRSAAAPSGTLGRWSGNDTDKTVRIIECGNLRIWANRKQFHSRKIFLANHGKLWDAKPEAVGLL